MPADRLLGTLVRSLQTYTDQQDTPRLLATAASLLTTLTNPLNITLLTAQLLTAPAIWNRPDGLHTCLRVMGVFHTASIAVSRHEAAAKDLHAGLSWPDPPRLAIDEWVRAVVRGADERSARWKHLMVLGGLQVGFGNQEEQMLSRSMRSTLETALVQAANLALDEVRDGDELGAHCIALVLNHSFGVLSDAERSRIDYDRLLPVLVGAAFFSSEGFQSAYFLGVIDLDLIEVAGKKFNWPVQASSYHQVQRILSRPLISSMGPLSRLTAHAVENIRDPWLIQMMMDDLIGFSRSLITQWRQNKLSEIDASEESMFLHDEALQTTLPQLWKLLKTALFAIVIVLRAVLGRVLGDGALTRDDIAPVISTQTLHILRNLYFISNRLGSNSFSQYTFVYLSAIDILTNYPNQAEAFIREIRPTELGRIPKHPLERCLDLYFLNTAEHFTLVLSPQVNEELLVAATAPYLAAGGSNHLLPIFEAAHSVMLAVLCAPQSAELAAKHLPFYVDALFMVFPQNLSPRQFRLAFKTLLRITAPPSLLCATHPDLPGALLELVHYRAFHAPAIPLLTDPTSPAAGTEDGTPPLSQQAVLTLTLLDSLPFLSLDLLEEWLPICADLLHVIPDEGMREACKRRFWDVLISGEMDSERSQVCVAWWNTRGGRERVLFGGGREEGEELMSGALPVAEERSRL